MYASGNGVPEDLVSAHMWFNLSAAQGNETAQSNGERIEQYMTREQIAEAQRLSREWIETHPQGGG
jgi:TPR repeat protein